MSADPQPCRRIVYHGRVQGVGFRATVASIAQRHPVAGFVRNLPDGTVEVVVQAAASELAAFLAEIAEAMLGYIEETVSEEWLGAETFRQFSIRR